jgi:hypothetical protein
MLARPVLRKPAGKDPAKSGQAKPREERFLLRVDGQTKRSFASLDDQHIGKFSAAPARAVG